MKDQRTNYETADVEAILEGSDELDMYVTSFFVFILFSFASSPFLSTPCLLSPTPVQIYEEGTTMVCYQGPSSRRVKSIQTILEIFYLVCLSSKV